MRINLVCVGKLTPLMTPLFAAYAARVSRMVDLRVVELREFNDDHVITQVARETQAISQAITTMRNPVLLVKGGAIVDSVGFAKLLNTPEITFIVGGSHGVVADYFPTQISFGQLTYPHQLFRVMLIEQIFRGLSINRNSPYHK